jgi:hypothetical protein
VMSTPAKAAGIQYRVGKALLSQYSPEQIERLYLRNAQTYH